MLHHPDGPSITYYRKRCEGFDSAPDNADSVMGTDMHERTVTGDVTGLSWFDAQALQFFWEESDRQVAEIFGDVEPESRAEERISVRSDGGEILTFGTADRLYWYEQVGLVVDGKFGWYAPTDPIQLQLYALGLAQERELHTVRGVFICPRLQQGKVQVWTWSRAELEGVVDEWREVTERARADSVRLTPAVDVCSCCAHLPSCPVAKRLSDTALEKRRVELADPGSVAKNLERCAVAKKHIEAYQAWALSEARKGFEIPGWTAQRRRGTKRVTDLGRFYAALNEVVMGHEITDLSVTPVAKVRDLFARRWAEKTGGTIREGLEQFAELTAECVEEGPESWSLKRDG